MYLLKFADTFLDRVADEIDLRVDIELLHDVFLVDAHRVQGEKQPFGNVSGGIAFGQELKYFFLPSGEGDKGWSFFSGVGFFDEAVNDVLGHCRGQKDLAAVNFADRLQDLIGRAFLEDVTSGAGFEGFFHKKPAVMDAENDDLGGRFHPYKTGCGLDTVENGHLYVEDEYVDGRGLGDLKDFMAVGGLGYDLDIILDLRLVLVLGHPDGGPEAVSYHRMIICDKYLYPHLTVLPITPLFFGRYRVYI